MDSFGDVLQQLRQVGLPGVCAEALRERGVTTKEQVREAVVHRKLCPNRIPYGYEDCSDYSIDIHMAICAWAGLTTFREQEEDLVNQADAMGGAHLVNIVKMLAAEGATVPIPENRALMFDNVGPVAVAALRKMNVVSESERELWETAEEHLRQQGILTKDQAREAITEGRVLVDFGSPSWGRYGWKMHKHVCEWAGLPPPDKEAMKRLIKSKRSKCCPHCGKEL